MNNSVISIYIYILKVIDFITFSVAKKNKVESFVRVSDSETFEENQNVCYNPPIFDELVPVMNYISGRLGQVSK